MKQKIAKLDYKYKKLIEENQISSLKRVLKDALEYHFLNFTKLEKLAEPYSIEDKTKIADAVVRLRANTTIKFELQAYINQLRRLKHFIKFLQEKGGFGEPKDPELKQIWYDIIEDKGVINMLANKWAAHRSVDDPKGESDSLHLAVLLNLEGAVTMWGNGHIFLSIDKYEFYLFHYHFKALKFIDWVFETVENKP